jgi:hypothetical protein
MFACIARLDSFARDAQPLAIPRHVCIILMAVSEEIPIFTTWQGPKAQQPSSTPGQAVWYLVDTIHEDSISCFVTVDIMTPRGKPTA